MILGYIDAGTGSLILQVVIGGLAGIAAFVKFRWGAIKARIKGEPEAEPELELERE